MNRLRRPLLLRIIGISLITVLGCGKHRNFGSGAVDLDSGVHPNTPLSVGDSDSTAREEPPGPDAEGAGTPTARLSVEDGNSDAATSPSSPQCGSNADCASPSASRCSNNQCVRCEANADCSHIDNTPGLAAGTLLGICDLSNPNGPQCVQCTGSERQACGADVCDFKTAECSASSPVGSSGLCEPCVSDAQCEAAARCVQQTFAGSDVGAFCFPLRVADQECALAPFSDLKTATTVDGLSADVCLLRRTTCPGLLDVNRTACTASADCGATGLDDGRCEGDVCSLPCQTGSDCFDPVPGSCLGGVCQL